MWMLRGGTRVGTEVRSGPVDRLREHSIVRFSLRVGIIVFRRNLGVKRAIYKRKEFRDALRLYAGISS